MLQQLEESKGNVPLPEQLVLESSPPKDKEANNVAFIVEEFPIEKFKNGNLEISLREPANAKRRKRREIDVVEVSLVPNATYRIIQRNEDTKNVSLKCNHGRLHTNITHSKLLSFTQDPEEGVL
jgi:hypothetical protein